MPHNVGLGDSAARLVGSVGLPFDRRDLKERTRFEPKPSPCTVSHDWESAIVEYGLVLTSPHLVGIFGRDCAGQIKAAREANIGVACELRGMMMHSVVADGRYPIRLDRYISKVKSI